MTTIHQVAARLRRMRDAVPLPRPTVRLRLTLIYGSLFLLSGAVLLVVTYVLVSQTSPGTVFAAKTTQGGGLVTVNPSGTTTIIGPRPGLLQAPVLGYSAAGSFDAPPPENLDTLAQKLTGVATQQRNDELHQLLVVSGIALGATALLSIGLGWLVAGRVLRPLRTMTGVVRDISASSLHRRLALRGPNDEMKELGTTFDGLLERLEQSFTAQRQFVANASHELRTPLARQRTLVEVALRDPAPTVESLRQAHQRVLAAGEQQEQIIEALLTLARSERGVDRRQACDLAVIADEVLLTRSPQLEQRRLHLDASLHDARLSGDPQLVERMVANLVDNAVRHNIDGGRISVETLTVDGHAVLRVGNSGPVIPGGEIERLFQPFQRYDAARGVHADGVGLGLSIVDAVVRAHGATMTTNAPESGGLQIEVAFPLSPLSC